MNTLGLSIGPPSQSTGFVVVETNGPVHAVRRLQRFPPGTSYREQRDAVQRVLDALTTPAVVLDVTGVGAPIAETFRWPKAGAVHVVLTAGESDPLARPTRLPRQDVAARLQLALQEGRLAIAPGPLAEGLARDLRVFSPKPGSGAASELAWRDRPSDDLVYALAVALWGADRGPARVSAVRIRSASVERV